MALRHRIAAKVTRATVRVARAATLPLVVVGWGMVLVVLYWQMIVLSHRKHQERERER